MEKEPKLAQKMQVVQVLVKPCYPNENLIASRKLRKTLFYQLINWILPAAKPLAP